MIEINDKAQLTLNLLNESKRTQYLTRLQTTPQVLSGYTVASHQHQCAMLYLTLCEVTHSAIEGKILVTLLTHDNIEVFTGDLLAPAKNAVGSIWDTVERKIQGEVIEKLEKALPVIPDMYEMVSELFPTDKQIESLYVFTAHTFIKLIDLSELLLRCLDEYENGNHSARLKECINNCISWIRDGYKDIIAQGKEDERLERLALMTEVLKTALALKLKTFEPTLKA